MKVSRTFVKPQHLLPFLHEKTHFKAAAEYSMITKTSGRTLNDKHREIEKTLEEAHYTIQTKDMKIPTRSKKSGTNLNDRENESLLSLEETKEPEREEYV